MADQEQLDDFLETLETAGSPASNAQLRGALGWPADQYEAVKAELAALKIVVRGRGRNDTVSLVGAEPVERPKAQSRNGQGMNPELFNELRKLRNEMAHGLAPMDPSDVTPISGPVPMRAGGVIKPPSIAGGLPGAYAPGEPSAVCSCCTPSCVALPIPLLPTTMRKSRYSRIHP